MNNLFNTKKIKYGSASIMFTALFITLVIILNIFVTFLAGRFNLTIDMTGTGFFDLSSETVTALNELKTPINIYVLDTESLRYTNYYYASSVPAKFLEAFPELLNKYQVYSSGMVTVEYINPVENPTAVSRFADLGSPNVMDIIVEGPFRSRRLDSTSFFEMSTDPSTSEQYISGLAFEQRLTSAIISTTAEVVSHAYMIKGHNESELIKLSEILEGANYTVGQLTLANEEIPDEAKLLVIAEPLSDYLPEEIDKLDAYFGRGGNAMVLFSPETPNLPVLERFLAEWGVSVIREVVFDQSNSLAYPFNVIAQIPQTEITGNLSASESYLMTPTSAPLEVLWQSKGWYTTTPIVYSYSAAYSKPMDTETLDRAPGDRTGPIELAVVSRFNDPNKNVTSNILFASVYMAYDSILETTGYLNSKLFDQILNYFNPASDSVIISPKVFSSPRLTVPAWQAGIIGIFLIIVIPLTFIISGWVVWLRRRNK